MKTSPPASTSEDPPGSAVAGVSGHGGATGSLLTRLLRMVEWRGLPFLLTIAGFGTVSFTAFLLSTQELVDITGSDVSRLFGINVVIFVLLLLLLLLRIVASWVLNRQNPFRGHLSIRLSLIFGTAVFFPMVIMVGFFLIFYNFGVESWFSRQVRSAVDASHSLAEVYAEESGNRIRLNALAVAHTIDRNAFQTLGNSAATQELFNLIAEVHSIYQASLLRYGPNAKGTILASAGFGFSTPTDHLNPDILERARNGEVVLIGEEASYRGAVVSLTTLPNTFLYIEQYLDPRIASLSEKARSASATYATLDVQRDDIEVSFIVVFVLMALVLTTAMIWFGTGLGQQITRPLDHLLEASNRMRQGQTGVQVRQTQGPREIRLFTEAFNAMAEQIHQQQHQLRRNNTDLEERRRFIEATLENVASGVISMDAEGIVLLANSRARNWLNVGTAQHLARSVPQLGPFIETALQQKGSDFQQQVSLQTKGGARTLNVHVIPLRSSGQGTEPGGETEPVGYLVTLDDVTTLIAAERRHAWSEVARRVAHEIKNPLTPIHLSVERLKRRYGTLMEEDEVFHGAVDTILRHVGNIERMISEFSSYARMPKPIIRSEEVVVLCREVLFEQRNSDPANDYVLENRLPTVYANCDRRLLHQALTNLILNARRAIKQTTDPKEKAMPPNAFESYQGKSENGPRGTITIRVGEERPLGRAEIAVLDNGIGFPPDKDFSAFLQPEVSGAPGGSGLGLSIVKKTLEDQGGELILEHRPGGGAEVRMLLPRS